MNNFIKSIFEYFLIIFGSMFVFLYGVGLLISILKNIYKYKFKFIKYVYIDLAEGFTDTIKSVAAYSGIATIVFIFIIFLGYLFE